MSTESTAAPAAQEPSTALTVQQRASLALGAPEHEKKLIELAKQATEIVAITNAASYQQAHSTRMSLKRARVTIEITAENTQEFQPEAESTREQTLARLREMHAAAVEHEAEAARLKAEREDLERQRAEQERREHEARARADAEARRVAEAEAERLRAIKAEENAARTRIEVQERDARERREAEERRLTEQRERIAAEARELEERQREARRVEEERQRQERLAAEVAERDLREAREAEEREEREKAEAEQRQREEAERERQRIQFEKTDISEAFKTLRQRIEPFAEFSWFAKAYDAQLNPKPARKRAATTA